MTTEAISGDPLTFKIIRAAIEVHRCLGPGLFESAYEEAMCEELRAEGLGVERQRLVPILYKGKPLQAKYRIDLIVDNAVVVEIKSVDTLGPVHTAQVLTYLKCAGLSTGLILNFNNPVLIDGIKRLRRWPAVP